MNLKTKYLSYNNGLPYYQRVVPPALQGYLKQRVIKIPLRRELSQDEQRRGISIELSLLGQVNHLGKLHTELFKTSLNNPGNITNWKECGVVHSQPREFLLSQSLATYLSNHQRGNDKRFIAYTKYKWDTFMRVIGDMPLRQLSRQHAKQYRDDRLKEGLKTATVKREIKNISAIIRKTLFELEIDKANPFSSIEISGLGADSIKREPFTHDEFKLLINDCLLRNDSKRRILLIAAFTGMRLGEIVGLRKDDIKFANRSDQIDYISIKPHSTRRLKTKGSARDIPIVPVLLDFICKQYKATNNSIYLFPEYMRETGALSNNASATLNKYIKSLGIEKSTHCLRHFLRDALRDAGITKDLIDSIGGWASGDIGSLYGKGSSLKMKLEALNLGYKDFFQI